MSCVGPTPAPRQHLGSLPPELEHALLRGTSVGGARPKALVEQGEKQFIAKFSLSSDTYDIVKAEFVAMKLAEKCSLKVASVSLVSLTPAFDICPQPRAGGEVNQAMEIGGHRRNLSTLDNALIKCQSRNQRDALVPGYPIQSAGVAIQAATQPSPLSRSNAGPFTPPS